MSSDYEKISEENTREYGNIARWGPGLLTRLYGERTHFLFELLQNAEDAIRRRPADMSRLPRAVAVDLTDDHIEVSHYGRPFDEADVRGICGIDVGTKRDDLNAIGKFGIGFKSVYAYTCSPEVHSRDEHFVIRDFVHPEAVKARESADSKTLFWIPFDRSDAKDNAEAEVRASLERLPARTLLFLTEIDTVTWAVGDASRVTLKREVGETIGCLPTVRLRSSTTNEDEEWLVFDREVKTTDGAWTARVKIAYLLERTVGGTRVEPVSDSKLFVYFSTDKDTRFGFLVHGPYRTTPSRDNVPERDEWNQHLIKETALLMCDSLRLLRDNGLLGVSALETMPIDAQQFSEDHMFRPAYDEVKKALGSEELVPRHGGGFVSGRNAAIARGEGLRELLSPRQLQVLLQRSDEPQWVAGDVTADRTPGLRKYLMEELGAVELRPEDIARNLTAEFMDAQSNEWVCHFYAYLLGLTYLWREGGPLRSQPFIRLADGSHTAPFDDDGNPSAYLPGARTDFPVVHTEVCQDQAALDFLKELGFAEPDTVDDVIAHVLPRYQIERAAAGGNYAADTIRILTAFEATWDSNSRRERLVAALRRAYFVRARRADGLGNPSYRQPDRVYFSSDDLRAYFENSDTAWFVDLSETASAPADTLRTLLEACGVHNHPVRVEIRPSLSDEDELRLRGGRRGSGVARDWTLDGLRVFLGALPSKSESGRPAGSLLLWRFLARAIQAHGERYLQGEYEWKTANGWPQPAVPFDANFVKELRSDAWLPDRDGTLKTPSELCRSELPPDFAETPVLEKRLAFKPEGLDVALRQAGIDPAIVELIRSKKLTLEQLQKLTEPLGPTGTRTIANEDTGSGGAVGPGSAAGTNGGIGGPGGHWPPGDGRSPGGHGGSGGGGESESHRELCRYVKEHPNLLAEGLRVESSDADLGTGDRPDLLLIDEAGGWAVAEVEAAIPTGNHIGMWQSVRYKHMAAAAKGVPCGEVRSFLVAPSIPDDVKHRCEQLGVEPREVVLPES